MSKIIQKVIVVSSAASGYRRAGFALAKGETELEVNEKQLAQLKADSRIAVQLVEGEVQTKKPETKKAETKKPAPKKPAVKKSDPKKSDAKNSEAKADK